MASRPQVKEGIGQKSQFNDLKLELKSHKAAEFETDDNIFNIELKSGGEDVRSIFNLFHYDDQGREEEDKTGGLILMKDRTIKYKLAVNKKGWYKFNIFATPVSNKSQSLPCVYTYVFCVNEVCKRAFPYPKQFADWKKDYYLHSPKYMDPSGNLDKVKFELTVPDAKKVAVTVNDEWFQLDKSSGKWRGEVALTHHFKHGKPQIKVNACTGSDETQYATLLMYSF